MPIPPYVLHLRTMVGRELLWMPGVTAVVLRDGPSGPGAVPEVLLVRRSDNGAWTPVTGIVDPGEHPHVTAVREVARGQADDLLDHVPDTGDTTTGRAVDDFVEQAADALRALDESVAETLRSLVPERP